MKDEAAKKIKWNYNAREDKIDYSQWWKEPLSKKRCLIPMSRFFESIDEGEYAGYMVAFHATNFPVLLAAGLYDDWTSQDGSKTLRTFTIITGDPNDFIKNIGHDRNPLFPEPQFYDEWLSEKTFDPKEIKKLLLENTINSKINFEVEKDRQKKAKPQTP